MTEKLEHMPTLAKIEKPPPHPMTLFKEYLGEAETYLKDTFSLFNLATSNLKGEVLNRTVVLRGHDDDGILFVTERNSRKYFDINENSNVSATFLWCYRKKGEEDKLVKHQVRVTGVAKELGADKIQKFYESEPIAYKIRSSICRCGEPVEWDELKKCHDKTIKNVLEGNEALDRNET